MISHDLKLERCRNHVIRHSNSFRKLPKVTERCRTRRLSLHEILRPEMFFFLKLKIYRNYIEDCQLNGIGTLDRKMTSFRQSENIITP